MMPLEDIQCSCTKEQLLLLSDSPVGVWKMEAKEVSMLYQHLVSLVRTSSTILKNLSCKKFTRWWNRRKSYSDLVYHWVLGTSRRSYWPYSHHFGTRSARLKWTNQPTNPINHGKVKTRHTTNYQDTLLWWAKEVLWPCPNSYCQPRTVPQFAKWQSDPNTLGFRKVAKSNALLRC